MKEIDGHIHFHNQSYSFETINNMVRVAKEKGIETLYLLDHTHKFKEFSFLYQYITDKSTLEWYNKKKPIKIEEYLSFVEEVKKKKWDVELKFGLEVCYFKEAERELREKLKEYDFDFLIGSIHFALGKAIDINKEVVKNSDIDELYLDYYDRMFSLIKSKIFTFLAHPDSIKLFGFEPTYDLRDTYIKLSDLLIRYDLETENNSGLVRYNYSYPGLKPELKEIFDIKGVKYHKASDAHKYEDIGRAFDIL